MAAIVVPDRPPPLGELRPTLALAVPVVLTELGWMVMGVVDTVMVGPLGTEAIGAVGLGNILFFMVNTFGYGLLLGLDTLVSQAFGAGKLDECHRSMAQGVYLSVALAVPSMAACWVVTSWLPALGIDASIAGPTRPYMNALSYSFLPLFGYVALRRYLQAMNVVRSVLIALVTANLVNWGANWVLIYGHLGMPRLGVAGSGWSTVIGRSWMLLALVVAVVAHDRRTGGGLWRSDLRPDWRRMRRLIGLGLPAAAYLALEVGVFTLASVFAARLGVAALAAHEMALQLASLTFMVPLGVSSAGAVRVGQAIGRGDLPGAGRAGWMALAIGLGFASCSALMFLSLPRTLLSIYTDDPSVLSLGATLLAIAAVFQLLDATQVIAAGNLRGAGDTRTPMLCNLVVHWFVGLPVGYIMAFTLGKGVVGLWLGLMTGLILSGLVLLGAWSRRAGRWRVAAGSHPGL